VFHMLEVKVRQPSESFTGKDRCVLPCTVNNTFSRNALATACVPKLSDCCTRRFESTARSVLLKTK
jgi:hypothetical protein